MAKKISKKAWKNFEITKVKLNPEQAVLSCCIDAAASRADAFAWDTSCYRDFVCGGTMATSSQSS
ncbi:MAG: hypothetical protein NT099_09350 [Candidatus Saganbacteria bacterium]|nr:hypothetical protein [Candidatus Saganbacteria bacterium]